MLSGLSNYSLNCSPTFHPNVNRKMVVIGAGKQIRHPIHNTHKTSTISLPYWRSHTSKTQQAYKLNYSHSFNNVQLCFLYTFFHGILIIFYGFIWRHRLQILMCNTRSKRVSIWFVVTVVPRQHETLNSIICISNLTALSSSCNPRMNYLNLLRSFEKQFRE